MAASRIARAALPNGLTALAVESRSIPIFAAVLAVEAGSCRDPEGKWGLASLTSSLLLEGSEDLAGDAMAVRLDALGASLEASCAHETTTLSAVGLSEHLRDVLDVMAGAAARPTLDRRMFEDVRRRELTAVVEDDDDPYCVCRREFFASVYGDHPRARPIEGRPATLRDLSVADARAFHGAWFAPGRAVLGLSGDFDAGAALDAAAEAFGGWTGDGRIETCDGPRPRRLKPARRFVRMDREQAHLSLGSLGIARDDPDFHAVAVMDVILGDSPGLASRLATRLREVEGLAYIIESDTVSTAGRDPGVFWAYTAVSPERARGAVDAIVDEMRRIRSSPPSEDEVAAAVAYLRGRHALDRETNESRASRLVGIERYGLGLDYEDAYPTLVGAVTRSQVFDAARRVVDPGDYSLVVVGPRRSRVP
ncbi:MAG: insulinase family protein [Candidatus Eisenbacteria bacterium]|nr:insulinase family protein [Candidatus Eisenbacteria bacterium]